MRKAAQTVASALGRPEILRVAKAKRILRDWPAVVGGPLAERSRPDRYGSGVVWVAVSGSSWAQELRMRKETILVRLGERAGDKTLFQDVRFGVRPFLPWADETAAEEEPERDDSELTIREIAARRLANWPVREA